MDHIYKYIRWLSIDIVLGAIFFLAFLEKYYQVYLSIHVYFSLASAVWLIYTTDHLMDGASLESPSNERHLFHKRYFNWLIIIGGVVLILALVNVYFLDSIIVKNGAILSAISVSYLLLVYFFRKLWVKELLVALVYTLGIFIGPLSKVEAIGGYDVLLVSQLAGIALLNLLIFSYYDKASDQKDGFNSLIIRLGNTKSKWMIFGLIIILISSILIIGIREEIQWMYLMMTALLTLVFYAPDTFSRNARYRTIGDGIFYLPGLFLLL